MPTSLTDSGPPLNNPQRPPLLAAADALPIALIACVTLLKVAVVPPTGEFPFADEWDYVGTIRHLLNTGHLTLSDWPTMTLVAHLAWGVPFAWLFGPSYAALRISMLVMSCLGAIGIYTWSRDCGWNRGPAVWLALAFALCPPTVCYEYSFMTDMTGMTGMIWLAVLLHRWKTWSTKSAFAIGAFASAAYLARQTALIPLIAWLPFAGLDVIRGRRPGRPLIILLGLLAAVALAHAIWLRKIHGLPFGDRLLAINPPDFSLIADRLQAIILGGALYAAPVLIGLWSKSDRRFSWPVAITFAALVALTLVVFRTIPSTFIRDEFFDTGMGFSNDPEGLRGPVLRFLGRELTLMRTVTTLLAAAGVWAGLTLVAEHRRRTSLQTLPASAAHSDAGSVGNEAANAHCGIGWIVAMTLLTAALPLATPMFHGRYIWPVSIACLMLLAAAFGKSRTSIPLAGLILTLLYGVVSIVGIQDSFARARAIWSASDRLQATGVSPADIGGLLEFGGAYRYLPLHRGEKNQGPYFESLSDAERRQLFEFIFGDKPYVIKLHPTPSCETIDTLQWRSWVRSGNVLVQKQAQSK